jgi:Raf kinase inhibitor-like YbhB/YbcL family protein
MNRTLRCCPLALVLLIGCNESNQKASVDPSSLEVGTTIPLTSSAFRQGRPIPREYTRISSNFSPPLAWSDVPPGVKSFAVICDDPDARGGAFVHWVIWNIPADVHELPEGVSALSKLPDGSRQGQNGFPGVGYAGPDPPSGGPHHYTFRLYALDALLDLPEYSTTREDLDRAMKGHVLGHGQLMGTYERMDEKK